MWSTKRYTADLGAANLSLKQGIEGPFHVAGSQRAAVVKLYPVMQMENVGERIGDLPAFGQTGADIEMRVAGEQVVEDKIVDAFRLSVQTHAGIEVGGAALNDHDHGIGVRFAGARKGCG